MADVRVLVVDDDRAELERCVGALGAIPDIRVEGVARSTEALKRIGGEDFDLLVTDLRMPVVDGMDLLRMAHSHDPDLPVLLLTGYPSIDTVLSALRQGAADYLTKPVHPGELVAVATRLLDERRVRRENRFLERRVTGGSDDELIGASAGMATLLDLVRRLAASDLDVLIVGETGTGKELVARRIHALTPRVRGRFVPVDCGAIPEHLMESELFGHEKGAFTGADRRSIGLLEYADGGTVLLDEIQSLPLHLQAKLLRVVQERSFRRVGAAKEVKLNVRIVAAANEDPEGLVRTGRMRQDLYHRLNVARLEVPPLRARAGDIRLLALHFADLYGRMRSGEARSFSEEALQVLEAYCWPGNVRELQNAVRRSLALSSAPLLTTQDLPPEVRREVRAGESGRPTASFREARQATVDQFEQDYIVNVLRETLGDVSAACRVAGLSRATFYRVLARHGIDPDRFRSP